MEISTCDVCGTPYTKKMKSQRYCSRLCYKRAWPINNREKSNAKQLARRTKNPQWYRSREPGYYRTYRTRLEASRPWRYLLISARNRARQKRLEFNLDDEWARLQWTGRCEITGIEFISNKDGRGPHPFSPSIDRKIANIGYTKENTRFIIFGCNAIKGSGTDEDMLIIARAILAHSSAIFSTIRVDHSAGSGVAAIPSAELVE